jgi:RNA polymerase sigma-70 factor (ECF subfamily)
VPTQQQDFERLAMPHLAALLRVARRLTLETSSAEDLVQETMLLAWRGFHQFDPATNARAWLFRILFNAFYARGRKPSFQPLSAEDGVHPKFQESAEISEAFNSLSLEQRTVVLLAIVEGFTCREIAGILDLPMGTVMSRLSRARDELRKMLAPAAKVAYR